MSERTLRMFTNQERVESLLAKLVSPELRNKCRIYLGPFILISLYRLVIAKPYYK